MKKRFKALLATGMILLSLTACNSTMEAKDEALYPITDALKENHSYTLTDYDFLRISTDTYQNNNGKIFKFSITTTNLYVVENIGKKDYGDYYIWYYSPCTPWSIGSYYNIKDTASRL